VAVEDSGDPPRRQPFGSHRSVEGEPIEERVEAFNLRRPSSASRETEHLDRAQGGRAQLVVDLGAASRPSRGNGR
jgi:hypothetical protein